MCCVLDGEEIVVHPILTLTMNPTIDKSTTVGTVVSEHKLRCSSPEFHPGGGGINVSRAIKKLGGDSQAFYVAGGYAGAHLDELLEGEDLPRRKFSIAGTTRENLIVLETSSGQQYRFGMPGPVLSEPEWRQCIQAIENLEYQPDYLVASGSLPRGVPDDFYAQLARTTQKKGIRLVLDTSGSALAVSVREGAFLIKPNLAEFKKLIGEDLNDESSQIEAARQMIAQGAAKIIVISLGAGGALAVTQDQHQYIRTPTVPIVSKVGAGDSMVAGMTLSLSRGMEVIDAARFGVAAGAAAVMSPGTELCRREDTERLYKQMT